MSPPSALRLHAEIETPRPLHARAYAVTVEGWCLFEELPEPPPVRLVTTAGTLPFTQRTTREDVPKLFPACPAAAGCGFVIAGQLPTGVHLASFEAQRPDGNWQQFKQLSLVIDPLPFAAVLDEPVATGVLRDRVKVGGWALDPASPVTELVLRYGHRELPCDLGLARSDVPRLFPDVPHAGRQRCRSRDFRPWPDTAPFACGPS